MIKKLTHLLGNVAGRIKDNMATVLITVGMTFVALAFSLLVWGGERTERDDQLVFWWSAVFVFILALLAWIGASMKAKQEDKERRDERKEFRDSFRNMNKQSDELHKSINSLIQEIRQERNERNRKR